MTAETEEKKKEETVEEEETSGEMHSNSLTEILSIMYVTIILAVLFLQIMFG